MDLKTLLEKLNKGETLYKGTDYFSSMNRVSEETRHQVYRLNNTEPDMDKLRKVFSEVIGKEVDETFSLFPPFYSDFGKNIHIGKNVFINSSCHFQDQGGIYIDDDVLIGHNCTLCTLNHLKDKNERGSVCPKPIHIKKGAWIGAGCIILPGVTIGEHSIIGAGSVITKDIPDNAIAVGNPCRKIKDLD